MFDILENFDSATRERLDGDVGYWDFQSVSALNVVNLLRLLVLVLVLRMIACVGVPKHQGRARYLRTLCLNRDYDVDRVR